MTNAPFCATTHRSKKEQGGGRGYVRTPRAAKGGGSGSPARRAPCQPRPAVRAPPSGGGGGVHGAHAERLAPPTCDLAAHTRSVLRGGLTPNQEREESHGARPRSDSGKAAAKRTGATKAGHRGEAPRATAAKETLDIFRPLCYNIVTSTKGMPFRL